MKQADMVTNKMIAAAELMMAGKINPRMANNYVGQLKAAADNSHKASIHSRYDKAVKRVDFFDKNITTKNQVVVASADEVTVSHPKNTIIVCQPKVRTRRK